MSFELGIDYGSRLYGSNQLSEKKCLIVENRRFDYTRALSDLAGVDIKSYHDDPIKLVRQVRNWFVETVGLKGVAAPRKIWYSFNDFMSDFYDEREAEGFSKDDLAWMPVVEFMDFIREWLGES